VKTRAVFVRNTMPPTAKVKVLGQNDRQTKNNIPPLLQRRGHKKECVY